MTAAVAVFWLGAFLSALAFAAWDDRKHTREQGARSNGRPLNTKRL